MINKKFSATLLALAALGLAACGSSSSESSTTSLTSEQSSETVDVPVVEGKYTVYFHLGSASVVQSLESYNSFFINGAFNAWSTSTAVPFVALAGSDVYYAQLDATGFAVSETDATFDTTKRGYQLTIGWNSTSNAPAEQQGTDYTIKADYNALYPGTSHPKMDAPVSSKIELFGATAVVADPDFPDTTSDEHWMADPATVVHYQTFLKQKAAVVSIKNYSIKFKIAEKDALEVSKPTWIADFYATGGYDSWGGALTDDFKLTADNDGYYTIKFGDVYGGVKIEYMVVCTVKNSEGTVVTTGFWTNKAHNANLDWTPVAADGDDAVVDAGDLVWEAWPSDPNVKFDVTIAIAVSDYPASGVDGVAIKGSWDWNTPVAMTAGASAGSFTVTLQLAAGSKEFGFITYTGAFVQVNWFSGTSGNLSITVSATATFSFTGSVAAGLALVA